MVTMLKQKIESTSATIGVIGLGYVGLPLAIEFVKKGFHVIGYDADAEKVQSLKEGRTYIRHIADWKICELNGTGLFKPTVDQKCIREMDAILICVPTPLTPQREPDMSYVVKSCELVAKHLRSGQLIVLESTTYPGTTDEVMKPILEKSGLKLNRDFYLAYSPEREDPNNQHYTTATIPKVVGCDNPEGLAAAKALYDAVVTKTVPVSTTRAAEATKLVENIYRCVNIALVNELKMLFTEMDIDVWEVINAAATKPFGYHPFYPGPGLGGHCLAGDEMVWVKNCRKAFVVSLQDLFETHKKKGSVRIKDDLEYIRPAELSIHSIAMRTAEQAWKPITYLFRRKYDGPIVSIKTNDNRMITVTERHPMLKITNNELEIVEARRLKVGDLLPIYVGGDVANTKEDGRLCIDLIDELPDALAAKVRVKRTDGSWKEYKREIYAEGKGDRKYDYIRDDLIPLELFRRLENKGKIELDHRNTILNTGRGPSVTSFPSVVEMDGSWMRLIGYYLSEGCATRERGFERVRITINRDERELFEDIRAISHVKGLSYSDSLSKRWKTRYIRMNSPLLGWLIVERLGCGRNSYTMKVPEEFMVLGRDMKRELLKGLFRGDGDVHLRSKMRTYRKSGKEYTHHDNSLTAGYFSISNVLFHQVVYLLQEIGIIPAIKSGKQRVLINGYDQISVISDWFVDDKGKKVSSYLKSVVRKSNKRRLSDIHAVQVKEVNVRRRAMPVYSVEVADNHTFAAAQGIYVHNCIPIDPFYLTWKAREYDMPTKFIELAGEINTQMPRYVVNRVSNALNDQHKALKKSKVLILGLAYKKDIDDMRESPSLKLMELLEERGAHVEYHDPYIPEIPVTREHADLAGRKSVSLDKVEDYDCVLIATDHTGIPYGDLVKRAKLVVDTRHAIPGPLTVPHVVRA